MRAPFRKWNASAEVGGPLHAGASTPGCCTEEMGGDPMALLRVSALVSGALGLWLYSAPSDAAVTHTTANLNLRAGPSMSHKVKAVIPAGAAIDMQ